MKKHILISMVLGSVLLGASPMVMADDYPEGSVNMISTLEKLKSKGFPFVREIKFDDGVYEVKAVNQQGNQIKIKVNPKTGEVIPEKEIKDQLSALEIAKRLEQAGFTKIYKIEISDEGDKYEVKAFNKEGQKVKLDVDAKSGSIAKSWF